MVRFSLRIRSRYVRSRHEFSANQLDSSGVYDRCNSLFFKEQSRKATGYKEEALGEKVGNVECSIFEYLITTLDTKSTSIPTSSSQLHRDSALFAAKQRPNALADVIVLNTILVRKR